MRGREAQGGVVPAQDRPVGPERPRWPTAVRQVAIWRRPGKDRRGELALAPSVGERSPAPDPSRTSSGGPRSVARVDAVQPSSRRGSSTSSSTRGARNGRSSMSAATTAGRSSRLVRASTAWVPPSSGQVRIARSGPRRARHPRPGRARAGPAHPAGADPLREPLRVVLDEPDRTLDDRHGQRWLTSRSTRRSPGKRSSEGQHATDIGEAPAVDRLVVVADEEDPVRRRGEQRGPAGAATGRRPGPRRRAGGAPGRATARGTPAPSRARAERAAHEIVEVEAAPLRDRRLVRDEGPRDRPGVGVGGDVGGLDGELQLQPRERGVQAPDLGRRDRRPQLARGAPTRSTSGSTGTPASRRISRPRAWNVRTRTAPAATPSGARRPRSAPPALSAARLLNVIAAIVPASTPPSMSHAIRATRVVVLPLPAGATHSTGPGGAVAAAAGRPSVARVGSHVGCIGTGSATGPPPTHRRLAGRDRLNRTARPAAPASACHEATASVPVDHQHRIGTDGGRSPAPNRPNRSLGGGTPGSTIVSYRRRGGASPRPGAEHEAHRRGSSTPPPSVRAGRGRRPGDGRAGERRYVPGRWRPDDDRLREHRQRGSRRPIGDGHRRRRLRGDVRGDQPRRRRPDASPSVCGSEQHMGDGAVLDVPDAVVGPMPSDWTADTRGLRGSRPERSSARRSRSSSRPRRPRATTISTTSCSRRSLSTGGSNDGTAFSRTPPALTILVRRRREHAAGPRPSPPT